MGTIFLVILSVLVLIVAIVGINLAKMPLNDFIEKKIVTKFLWLWLPFHAFGKLSKELREKYTK